MNCEQCESLYFADRESLEYHMQTHHDSSLYAEAFPQAYESCQSSDEFKRTPALAMYACFKAGYLCKEGEQ